MKDDKATAAKQEKNEKEIKGRQDKKKMIEKWGKDKSEKEGK